MGFQAAGVSFPAPARHLTVCTNYWPTAAALLGVWWPLLQQSEQRQPGYDISTYAAVCLLRGRACEALENRQRAIACYTAALQ